MGKIKVYEYHSQPLEEIEFPDGTVWKLRQPLEQDQPFPHLAAPAAESEYRL